MSNDQTVLLAILVAPIALWTVVGWLRIYQLAQARQMEASTGEHHRDSLAQDRACGLTYLCVVALVLTWGLLDAAQAIGLNSQWGSCVLALVHVGLALLAIRVRPRNDGVSDKNDLSGRTIRLTAVALVIDTLPAILMCFCLWVGVELSLSFVPYFSSFNAYPNDLNWAVVALWTTLTELPVFAFAPYALKIAGVMLWPVEKLISRSSVGTGSIA